MFEEWTTAQEAERLRARFEAVDNKAEFARKHNVPGGASMLSQHLSGHRPMSLAAATAYAAGFGVSLEEISPRLAKEVAAATSVNHPRSSNVEPGPDIRGAVPLISWVQAGQWCEAITPTDSCCTPELLVAAERKGRYLSSETMLPCPVAHNPAPSPCACAATA